MLRKIISRIKTGSLNEGIGKNISNEDYWSRHNVTAHRQFVTRNESLDYLHWRNSQYLFYEELMPGRGFDDLIILDYGCGPGDDLVGFVEHSKPRKVTGVDIAFSSLEESRKRLLLHPADMVDLQLIKEGSSRLNFEDNTFDYIHSSGVLHHTANIGQILREFYRILKPSGFIRIMVYNYDSLWLHLYVAYQRCILQQIDATVSLSEAFKRSTDGPDCPISICYKKDDFLELGARSGLSGKFLGAAISLHEMSLLPLRYNAIQDIKLDREHRNFLKELTFDAFGRPLRNGQVAGIDGCYELKK
ncbi:MAG: class I SAM-dependent methyltransferase [Planctomycetota bacterium]